MNNRFSLKVKMIAIFIALISFSSLVLTTISYMNSKKMAKELTLHTLTMKMDGDINAARLYVQRYLTAIEMKDGKLTDGSGNPIEGNFEMVDAIRKDLGVVATIFARENNDFRRISTNIMKDDGKRAVGTFLGKASAAYEPVMNRKLFIGEAIILGENYLTAYDPILAKDGSLIGILFVGIPRGEVMRIAQGHSNALLRQSLLAFIAVLIVAMIATVWFASSLSHHISECGKSLFDGAHQVNMAAGQLSNSSNSLAEGATEQAASLEETSSSLEEMSTMTRNNASNATEASSFAENAKQAAAQGRESMTAMMTAIHEIQSSANKTANIVKVIDEIAFQTNLLALNAAVEAARAGEAGKGFAVVADEVRNLARRSAEAARDTTELIEASVENARNGVTLSDKVNTVFTDIAKAIEKTTAIMAEISGANHEQAQGIEQINVAVSQVDIVTQRNAANAEESASAAAELSAQAESMRRSVEYLQTLILGRSHSHF
ncbi:MAG: Cache 3/Cache 2 fusion domain-containing protein [Pontiellaceae bacterium]|nr:Cache 3/Cache 2 fusion domain-containing protein [Pontiellaceae bacterium]MBN2785928.1 Cache 3/Cache 2 fusion domain-containing protein [Pontiellaceae bacterium]